MGETEGGAGPRVRRATTEIPKHRRRNRRPQGKAEAAHQYLVPTRPVSAGLYAEEVASAESAYLYIVISTARQFKAAQTGAELNVVQLPVKPRAGRNDL